MCDALDCRISAFKDKEAYGILFPCGTEMEIMFHCFWGIGYLLVVEDAVDKPGSIFMLVKLFILGRPGSGKSYAARYFELDVRIRGGSSYRVNDYKHLRQQFIFDRNHIRFEPIGEEGFNVRDPSVLNEALAEVIKEAKTCCEAQMYDLAIIEFARPVYGDALRKFGNKFLQDALFLFIDADLNTCFE